MDADVKVVLEFFLYARVVFAVFVAGYIFARIASRVGGRR